MDDSVTVEMFCTLRDLAEKVSWGKKMLAQYGYDQVVKVFVNLPARADILDAFHENTDNGFIYIPVSEYKTRSQIGQMMGAEIHCIPEYFAEEKEPVYQVFAVVNRR